ncbi:RNA polymerase sigma factor, partial [Streptomyces sp. NRRL S-444]
MPYAEITEGIPQDTLSVSTGEARTLSGALFHRLRALDEGSAEYSYVRNTLVELNLSLVKFAARRFRGRSEP